MLTNFSRIQAEAQSLPVDISHLPQRLPCAAPKPTLLERIRARLRRKALTPRRAVLGIDLSFFLLEDVVLCWQTLVYYGAGLIIGVPSLIMAIRYLGDVYSYEELLNVKFLAYLATALLSVGPLLFACACIGRCRLRDLKNGLDNSAVCTINIGPPGSGKSATTVYDAVREAARRWAKVKFDYWMLGGIVDKLITSHSTKLDYYYELKSCYEYYKSRPDQIPLLWSNIPMQIRGRYAGVLTREHALQERKLPIMSVLVFDEIGAIFQCDEGRKGDRPLKISDFFRLCRHFNMLRIFGTEQDSSNIFIDARRVVSYNCYMQSQEWFLKPVLLLLPLDFLRWWRSFSYDVEFDVKKSKFWSKYLDFVSAVGFRRIKFGYEKNTERSSSGKLGKGYIFLPSVLPAKYNDRCFADLYECKSGVIDSARWDTMTIPPNSSLGQQFLRRKIVVKAKPGTKTKRKT